MRSAAVIQQVLRRPGGGGGGAGDAPAQPIAIQPGWSAERRALVNTYNRLGGMMTRLGRDNGVEVPAILAVWSVESSGRPHQPGRAIIRFENHILFQQWGQSHASTYDQHFRHGGRAPQTMDSCRNANGVLQGWKCHQYRRGTGTPFVDCHEDQAQEYDVLDVAIGLAGDDVALRCMSIGGAQIMGFNFASAGFSSPREMFDTMQGSEGTHVTAFFEVIKRLGGSGRALRAIQDRDWAEFARIYNGASNVPTYSARMLAAYNEVRPVF